MTIAAGTTATTPITTSTTTTSPVPGGVLLIGSTPLQSAAAAFTHASRSLSSLLHSIPDAETGVRSNFIFWQKQVFPRAILQARAGGPAEVNDDAAAGFSYNLSDFKPTHYDTVALESYAMFRQLKAQGKIEQKVRFQVSLPSPLTVARMFVQTRFCAAAEEMYERRLVEAVRRIQEEIPAHELLVQWDVPLEVGMLEYAAGRLGDDAFRPYFRDLDREERADRTGVTEGGSDASADASAGTGGDSTNTSPSYLSLVRKSILSRWRRLLSTLDPAVHVGFHLCYGDIQHEHFIQPLTMRLLVDLANDLVRELSATHQITYIHMPVPKDQPGEASQASSAFFKPLADLRLAEAGCKLFLGVVHAGDLEGTWRRIEAARAWLPDAERCGMGVASECGLGRTPEGEVGGIFEIMREVAAPVEL